MKVYQKLLCGVFPIVMALAAPPTAAGIIVSLQSVTSTSLNLCPGGTPTYLWNFSAAITPTDGFTLDDEGYFTIYDLPGTVCTVEAPQLWTASSANTGKTPTGLTPTDDASIRNVTFTYGTLTSGSRPGADALPSPAEFRVLLSVGSGALGQYSWQDYSAYPVSSGQLQSGLGTFPQNNVPEPATLALLGLGLAGLGAIRRKRS